MMQNIEKLTEGRVALGPGTLYGAINALVQKRWINAVSTEQTTRKIEYIITEAGRTAFRGEHDRLKELLRNSENMRGDY